MPLTSKIVPYDASWPSRYRDEAARLRAVFDCALLEIHHIGSTAVPGLSAKPEIDILVVVSNTYSADSWAETLTTLRYRRGRDLSLGHLFYKRDIEGVRTHKIHVCLAGYPKIKEMLNFRDYLRMHDETRDDYQALKIELERRNTAGIGEYLAGKEPFIRAVLEQIERD